MLPRLLLGISTCVLLVLVTQPAGSQSAIDSVVPAIERGDLKTAERILGPLAAEGDVWAYFNLGVVASHKAWASEGRLRTLWTIDAYAHYRAAELLGDSTATPQRREALALIPSADLPTAGARVAVLLSRHGKESLARAGTDAASVALRDYSATVAAASHKPASARSLPELSEAIRTQELSYKEREVLARELAARPGGREELASILTVTVFATVASGPANGSRSPSYIAAEQFGALLCEILARAPSPSVSALVAVQSASESLGQYNPGSPLIGGMEALLDAWQGGGTKPTPGQSVESDCATTDTPSAPCLQLWISGFTQPGARLSNTCVNKVAGLSAMGFVPDAGGRSDEDDLQRAIHYCIEGNAFVAYQRWHPQLRRSAPRQFERMEDAYRIARRLNLIFVM
jgi:hypothetical protein